MADNTTKTQGKIVVDKNKTAEQYIAEAEKFFIIPKLVREKFTDLVKLVYETESMDEDEREYWMQILPIMDEAQIVKLRDILVNERQELAKLDNDYRREMQKINANKKIDEVELKEKLEQIEEAEEKSEDNEQDDEQALLDQLKNL